MSTPGTKIDCEYDALVAYSGALQDKELAWLQNNGATSTNLADAWIEFLAIQLGVAATGNRMTDELAYYQSIAGLVASTDGDTISDLRREFWCGGYNPP